MTISKSTAPHQEVTGFKTTHFYSLNISSIVIWN